MDYNEILERLKDKPEMQAELKAKLELADKAEVIRANNADLTRQREDWEKKEAEYKKTKPATQPTTNNADVNALKEELDQLKGKWERSESEKAKAIAENREKDLKTNIYSIATQYKAKPNQLYNLLKADGHIGHKEDGTPYYQKLNDKNEPVAVAKPEDVVQWYLGLNKNLVESSGTIGAGSTQKAGTSSDGFNASEWLNK